MTSSHDTRQHSSHSLRRDQRLRRRSDFEALRQPAVSRAHPLVILRAAPNLLPFSRYGFVVSRRVATQAVVRNRVRRQLREAVRQAGIRPGWDLLFIARSAAAEAGSGKVREVVQEVARRAKLLDNAHTVADAHAVKGE